MASSAVTERFREDLERIRAAGLYRQLRPSAGLVDTWVTIEGRRTLLLCSNNYLGLASHPALADAAARAAHEHGDGVPAQDLAHVDLFAARCGLGQPLRRQDTTRRPRRRAAAHALRAANSTWSGPR